MSPEATQAIRPPRPMHLATDAQPGHGRHRRPLSPRTDDY